MEGHVRERVMRALAVHYRACRGRGGVRLALVTFGGGRLASTDCPRLSTFHA